MAIDAGADISRIPELKKLILRAAEESREELGLQGKIGVFVDGTYGQAVLNEVTGKGWWVARPIELPGSRPLRLEHGNIGSQLISWPAEQIVKCLVFYHPDDSLEMRLEHESLVREVYKSCCQSGHELLLEVILPASKPRTDENYLRTLKRFYNLGIKPDWWKLPPLSAPSWKEVEHLVNTNDPHCHGVVILGLDAPMDELEAGFNQASQSKMVKGFAVGRSIFSGPSKAWLANEINDDEMVAGIKQNYSHLVNVWNKRGL